jgi:hypothetical protein
LTGIIIPVGKSLSVVVSLKADARIIYMEVLEKIEKILNIKIENIKEVKGRSFPLFDTVNVHGIKLALVKNPLFVVIEDDDVYEKRIEGDFVVVEKEDGFILAEYVGTPNIEVLRVAAAEKEEPEQIAGEVEQEAETQGEGSGEADSNEDEVQKSEEDEGRSGVNPVEEILEKLPKWADGAVIVEKSGNIVVLPIKKSTKREGAYYASASWKPLDTSGVEELVNCVVTKNGQVAEANVYVGDRYINIFIRGSQSRPRRRGRYSGRR